MKNELKSEMDITEAILHIRTGSPGADELENLSPKTLVALRAIYQHMLSARPEIDRLTARVERLRKGLEHYANQENWLHSRSIFDDMDDEQYDRVPKDLYIVDDDHGYTVAQEALASIDKGGESENAL